MATEVAEEYACVDFVPPGGDRRRVGSHDSIRSRRIRELHILIVTDREFIVQGISAVRYEP